MCCFYLYFQILFASILKDYDLHNAYALDIPEERKRTLPDLLQESRKNAHEAIVKVQQNVSTCTTNGVHPCTIDADCYSSCYTSSCIDSACNNNLSPCCGMIVEITVHFFNRHSEISWYLHNLLTKDIIEKEDRYQCGQYKDERKMCLPFGYYEFVINDSNGDGLFGYYGSDGHFELALREGVNETKKVLLHKSGWEYGTTDFIKFGICTNDMHCNDGDDCTLDTCDTNTKTCRYVRDCSLCSMKQWKLQVKSDGYLGGKYIRWEVRDKTSQIKEASLFHQNEMMYPHGTLNEDLFCLPTENSFIKELIIFLDIDISQSNAWYKLFDENGVVHVEQRYMNFMYFEIIQFMTKEQGCTSDFDCNDHDPCTMDSCQADSNVCHYEQDCLACQKGLLEIKGSYAWLFQHPAIISRSGTFNWDLKNSTNDIVRSNKVELGLPYTLGDSLFPLTFCAKAGTYTFTISDYTDNNGGIKNYNYAITANHHILSDINHMSHLQEFVFGICFHDSDCVSNDPCIVATCDVAQHTCNFHSLHCQECKVDFDPCTTGHYWNKSICIRTCGCGRLKLSIDFKTDDRPSENSWKLRSLETNDIIVQSLPFDSNYYLYSFETCLSNSSYKFEVFDTGLTYESFGIGYPGYYKLSINDNSIFEEHGYENDWKLWKFNELETIICSHDSECEDNNPCTQDVCNTTSKQCLHIPSFSLCRSHGNPKVLAIRVTASDSQTTLTQDNITNALFNQQHLSMSSQFTACSFTKFNLNPFDGVTSTGKLITNGVTEIHLDMNVVGEQAGVVYNAIVSVATNTLGNLESQFDFLLFCLPPGTVVADSNSWKAYAFLFNSQSVYNDRNCQYPSVLMHELGHNLGLSHSSDEKNYGDETGMMGISYSQVDGPRKCFNAAKTWELGWFFESHIICDFDTLVFDQSVRYDLVGLSEYATRRYRYTIVKIINTKDGLDYYICWNRATNMNIGTKESLNEMQVISRPSGYHYEDSYLVFGGGDYILYGVDDAVSLVIRSALYPFDHIFTHEHNYITITKTKSSTCSVKEDCEDDNACTIKNCIDNICQYFEKACLECGQNVTIEIESSEFPDRLNWNVRDFATNDVVLASGYNTKQHSLEYKWKCIEFGTYAFSLIFENSTEMQGAASFAVLVGDIYIDYGNITKETYIESIFIICSTDEDCYDYDGCTVDYCDQNTKLCNNTDSNCFDCTFLALNITTDNFPEETVWGIYDTRDSSLVLSGDPYSYDLVSVFGRRKAPTKSGRRKAPTKAGRRKAPTRAGRRKAPTKAGRRKAPTRTSANGRNLEALFYRKMNEEDNYYDDDYVEMEEGDDIYEEICLQKDIIYHFIITDAFGDGICCTEGFGSFRLKINETVLIEGGEFTTVQETFFKFNNCVSDEDCDSYDECIIGTCNPFISTCSFYVQSCSDCGASYSLSFKTDHTPNENVWRLSKRGEAISQGGPYPVPHEHYENSACLSFGTYTFSITDSARNGMGYGDKEYISIHVNEYKVLSVDGDFASYFESHFGVCNNDTHCNDLDDCTQDICDIEKRVCKFQQLPCSSCGKRQFQIQFSTTYYPTSDQSDVGMLLADPLYWELISFSSEDVMLTGGPYKKHHHNYVAEVCLPEGDYLFKIPFIERFYVDSEYEKRVPRYFMCADFARGIYFEYDDQYNDDFNMQRCGNYTISVDDKKIRFVGYYTSLDDTTARFAIDSICFNDEHCKKNVGPCSKCNLSENRCEDNNENGCSHCDRISLIIHIYTDAFPSETSWGLYSDESLILSGGKYWEENTFFEYKHCLLPGSYSFLILDAFGDGMEVCDLDFCGYVISLNGEEIKRESLFDFDEVSFGTPCLSDQDCIDNILCTSDICNKTSGRCINRQLSCTECGGSNAIIDIYTHSYPDRLSWNLINFNTGESLLTNGYYGRPDEHQYDYEKEKYTICLNPGEYLFLFKDASNWGDDIGAACLNRKYVCGYYIILDGKLIKTGKDFGSEESTLLQVKAKSQCLDDNMCDDNNICTVDTCHQGLCMHDTLPCLECGGKILDLTVTTDLFPYEVEWNVTDLNSDNIVIYDGRYNDAYETFTYSTCLPPGDYVFSIKDVSGDGYGGYCHNHDVNCGYDLKLDKEVLRTASYFVEDLVYINILWPSAVPSFVPTLYPSFSQVPTNIPSTYPSVPPSSPYFDMFVLEFDKFLKESTDNLFLDGISLQFIVSKGQISNQFVATTLDRNCNEESTEGSVTVTKKIIRSELEDVDSAIVILHFDKTLIKQSQLWERDSKGSGKIQLCLRTEIYSHSGISVTFLNTILKINVNLFSSTFNIDKVLSKKNDVYKIDEDVAIVIDACICDLNFNPDSFECVVNDDEGKVKIAQNAFFNVCLSAPQHIKIAKVERVVMAQDGLEKYKAIANGMSSGLASILAVGEETSVIELPMVSIFFKKASPSPITISGQALLQLENSRELQENHFGFMDGKVEDSGSFEILIYPNVISTNSFAMKTNVVRVLIALVFGMILTFIMLFKRPKEEVVVKYSPLNSEDTTYS